MGKEEDPAVGAMASSTVPCHATQYSWPKKLKNSQHSALPLYPLSRTSLEQRPGLSCAQKMRHPLHVAGLSSMSL